MVNDVPITRVEMDGVLDIIKRDFMVNETGVSLPMVYETAEKAPLKLNRSEIKWIITKLAESNRITHDKNKPGFVLPILTLDDLKLAKELKEKPILTLDKIEKCIEEFTMRVKYPDLLQLEEMFIELFGVVESEKFKGFVRDLVKDGKLEKTQFFTYKGIKKEPVDKKISKFTEEEKP